MVKNQQIISFQYGRNKIKFVEPIPIDYISEKIKTESQFYENELLTWLKTINIPQGDFVDIGANIGNHTIFFSKILNRKTWSYEPYDRAFEILEQNIKLNNADAQIFNYGIGSKECSVRMVLPSGNNIGAAHAQTDIEGRSLLKNGDEALEDINKISLIKIDVEGYEQDVLEGCINTIRKHKPLLLVECIDKDEFDKNFSILKKLNYSPVAVFGATPMVVFTPNTGLTKNIDTPSILLDKYFEVDAKFNKSRNYQIALSKQLDQQSTVMADLSRKIDILKVSLANSINDLQRVRSSESKLRKRVDAIINSHSYKIGRRITYPTRKIKKYLSK